MTAATEVLTSGHAMGRYDCAVKNKVIENALCLVGGSGGNYTELVATTGGRLLLLQVAGRHARSCSNETARVCVCFSPPEASRV
jgi:hypothetical protein